MNPGFGLFAVGRIGGNFTRTRGVYNPRSLKMRQPAHRFGEVWGSRGVKAQPMAQLFEFITNHPLLVGTFMALLGLFVANELRRGGRSVSAQQLVNLVNNDGAIVVDVRDSKEFAAGHIVGAINIPHTAIESRKSELEKHKEKTLVLACKMGQHSGAAGTTLRKAGFENVARLTGGIVEWRNQNLPVVKGS